MRRATWWTLLGVMLVSGPALRAADPAEVPAQASPGGLEAENGVAPRPVPEQLRSRPEIEQAVRTGAWERAEQMLAAEIERTPDSPELLIFLADVFMADRKPLNAAIAIKKAEALGPIDERTRFTLALAYVALKRGDWARPELERLAADNPANTRYQYWLGRLDYDAGQFASAIRRFQAVIEREPDFVRARDNLALSYEGIHAPDRAIAEYREAIRLNRLAAKKSPWPPLNLGILFRGREELDEAERLFREALEYDDRSAAARYQLGATLEQKGRFDEAVTELERAAAADPEMPEPHYALGRLYRRQGRRAEADAELKTFLRLRDAKEGQ